MVLVELHWPDSFRSTHYLLFGFVVCRSLKIHIVLAKNKKEHALSAISNPRVKLSMGKKRGETKKSHLEQYTCGCCHPGRKAEASKSSSLLCHMHVILMHERQTRNLTRKM